ncbi:MAG TPA: phospholipase [Polaromonas sp.]|uniref:phospholipase n=1 Tax=Polaromonas sp. TaxID=1869339 RepID=UPI002D3DF68A|nr:phospholipase [Polaromonas sp.]HYW57307.1 phospholipase [Polaromonas sp.]
MSAKVLRIYAGPKARRHIEQHGLNPQDVRVVPGAAGGPKGLVLGPLDRFIFGNWLTASQQEIHLVGASIGAWRMATACLDDPVTAFQKLEDDYIQQYITAAPGKKLPSAQIVSEQFGQSLIDFYGGRINQVLQHPRYRLHIVTSRGRHVMRRENGVATPLGYLGAFVTNALHRKAMGAWLERVVFSSQDAALPFATGDYRTRQLPLTEANFNPALQASCSIPFLLKAVHNIPGAPPGAYWDGGITDYHLHLDYASELIAAGASGIRADGTFASQSTAKQGLVLYPHFQKAVVPGWLDKSLKWRHGSTPFLDSTVLLAPDPAWIKSLPNSKLPDRNDFVRYAADPQGRMTVWTKAVAASRRLADEFQEWLGKPEMGRIEAL